MAKVSAVHLTDAAIQIEAFLVGLNENKSTCECCGVVRYENWAEHQTAVELRAAVAKLHKHAAFYLKEENGASP